jgi:hypothetical protein
MLLTGKPLNLWGIYELLKQTSFIRKHKVIPPRLGIIGRDTNAARVKPVYHMTEI